MGRRLTKLTSALAAAAALSLAGTTAWAGAPTTAECLTASEASLKSATDHKLRTERAQLLVCAAATCPEVVRKECLSHVDEVNAEIPTIIFGAKDSTGADLGAVKVGMDGEPLTDKLDGAALSVDPGQHVFTFEATGLDPVTKTFLIQQSQKDRREQITFEAKAGAVAPPRASGLGTQKILAIAAGGVGLVGLGVGAAFGGLTLSQKSTAVSACPGAACSTPAGVKDWSNATSSGTVSTIGFIVGGVGVAAAAVLWFTAPTTKGTTAQVGFGPGGLQVRGSW